ncbi:SsrA-binding protein SmpB [Candidatus Acetothermia bacterium]|jgi:SsrA-binding protein|nr:SsrA-binding protein SmpB [Candidatus Acetothermia bacterium]MCI2432538.1 SsrA-binding protein SmpB [Candidatus Acetothermia bacterium]MCI2436568.1 SsrA-binding protein SmpB [Candidatus Acetothermia bacterium]
MSERIAATNRKARHEYQIEERLEAGIALTGTEVKSVRRGSVNLQDGFALVRNGEVFLLNVYIAPYQEGNRYNPDPLRKRKLLLRKPEIYRLQSKVKEKGYTLVPLRIYFKNGWAKVELALAKGLTRYDRREKIKKRESDRELRRVMKTT